MSGSRNDHDDGIAGRARFERRGDEGNHLGKSKRQEKGTKKK